MLSGTDVNILTKLYEELRTWVVDPSCEPRTGLRHLGWGVLVSRGMREWMVTCMSFSGVVEHDRGTRSGLPGPLAASTQAELTAALASVLLSHCQGATT